MQWHTTAQAKNKDRLEREQQVALMAVKQGASVLVAGCVV